MPERDVHARRWIFGIGALVALGIAIWIASRPTSDPTCPETARRTSYPVLEVIDGDTIAVAIAGERERVRLIGVDTPETRHPNRTVEYFGPEATRFLTALLAEERVHLALEPGTTHTDKFGRVLAYVYRASDGLFVNAEILRCGYGHVLTRYPFEHMELFRALARDARVAGRGLWGDSPDHASFAGAPDPAMVYVTPSGRKYHRRGCRHVSENFEAVSVTEAESRALEPCGACEP